MSDPDSPAPSAPAARAPLRTFAPAAPLPEGGWLHHRWQGTMYPPFIDPVATRALCDGWDTDADDIFISTHQKVGTHLAKKYLVEVLRALYPYPEGSGMHAGDIGHHTVPWPEVTWSQEGREAFERFVSSTAGLPRAWYVHSSWEQFPARTRHPDSRYLVVVRDPRGAAVSQYFFYKRHPLLQVPADLELDAFVERFVDGDLYFGDYHQHVLSWLRREGHAGAPGTALVLRYEELVERKAACVDRLVTFVAPGRQLDPAVRDRIAASTEFDTMKQSLTENPGSFHLRPDVFFRAGTTRDWERHLSPRAVELIDAKTRAVWGGDDLSCPPLDGQHTLEAAT